jgi:hypothetical protein
VGGAGGAGLGSCAGASRRMASSAEERGGVDLGKPLAGFSRAWAGFSRCCGFSRSGSELFESGNFETVRLFPV